MEIEEIQNFVRGHNKKVEELYKEMCLAFWDASISGINEDYEKYQILTEKMQEIYNNKKDFEKIKEFRKIKVEDEILKRQLEVLYYAFLSSQGDMELIKKIIFLGSKIEQKFNVFRANVRGEELTDNQIKSILENDDNSETLKEVWMASKKQGSVVVNDLIELIKLRNQLARENGFENYYEMSMKCSEQNPEEIEKIFRELEELTNKPFFELKKEIDLFLMKKYGTGEKELAPWHYQDLFFQEGPEIYSFKLEDYYKNIIEIAKKFYEKIGLNVEDILSRSDLYEKKGKNQHAYCIDIDRKGDIRVLENIVDNEKWMETSLHELGHASYQKFINKELPFILRDNAHIFVTEAIAMLFGRQSKNISFLKRNTKISEADSLKAEKKITNMLRLRQLVFARWAMVMRHFESELYKNPEQNLNELWWNLVKKYQLINFSRDEPDWASKIHLVSSPVYYHNYMLGEMFASQLNHFIGREIFKKNDLNNLDYSEKREIGIMLKERIFSFGMLYRWDELIKKATGEDLTAKHFIEQFTRKIV